MKKIMWMEKDTKKYMHNFIQPAVCILIWIISVIKLFSNTIYLENSNM